MTEVKSRVKLRSPQLQSPQMTSGRLYRVMRYPVKDNYPGRKDIRWHLRIPRISVV